MFKPAAFRRSKPRLYGQIKKQGPQSATCYKPHEWRKKLLQMALQIEIRSTTERQGMEDRDIALSGHRDIGTAWLSFAGIVYQFSRHSRPHRRYRLSKTCACRLESLRTQPLFPVLRQEGRSSRVCCRNDADFFAGCRKPAVRAVIRQPRPAFDCPRNATLFASVRGRFRSAERALPTCTI